MSNLNRVRWAVRVVMTLGIVVSLLANVLAAEPHVISRLISAWPPLALLLTVELISRVPASKRWLAVVRIGATALIAGIAGWVSYWHMVSVCAQYGETGVSAYAVPLTVDGLVVVTSVCLVELGDRIKSLGTVPNTDTAQVSPIPSESAAPASVAVTVRAVDVVPAGVRTLPIVARQAPHPVDPTSRKPKGGSRTGQVSPRTVARVLAARTADPHATVAALAKAVRLSERTVHRALAASTA